MSQERIGIGRLDHPGRALQRRLDVAVLADDVGPWLAGEGCGLGGEIRAGLLGRGAVAPGHLQLAARLVRLVPGVGHDGDAAEQTGEVFPAIDHEGVADARTGRDLIQVGADHLGAEHRRLLVDGVEHPGADHVDAEQRLAGDDQRVVDARRRLADDLVILGILQSDRLQVGRRQGAGPGGQGAVVELLAGGHVLHGTRAGGAVGGAAAPGLGGGGDQHLTASRAGAAQGLPVHRGGETAAGELGPVFCWIVVGLLDADILPVDVEFFGDQHGQHGLDALTDLRILGHDGDDAVGGDADESVERRQVGFALAGDGHRRLGRERHGQGEQHAAAGDSAGLQEGAARRVLWTVIEGGVGGAVEQHDQALVSSVGRPAACLMAARMRT